MANRHDAIRNELVQRDGNYCAICGQAFDSVEATIDHIYPRSLGGKTELDNLQLLCPACNIAKGTTPGILLGHQFESYIIQLLSDHPSYEHIQTNTRTRADIIVDYKTEAGVVPVICELKTATSFTSDRIRAIISSLDNLRQEMPGARTAFVFPGELPDKYAASLRDAGIEIWDKGFLSREFEEQIKPRSTSIFSKLIHSGPEEYLSKRTIDKFTETIQELKCCPYGKECWGRYQKLVGKILEILFCPELESLVSQAEDFTRNNRRDFIMANYSSGMIWSYLRNRYCADYIVVDAKNSGKPILKSDILQMGHYLKEGGAGLFGVIISRKGISRSASYAQRELWIQDKKMIVVLSDEDMEQMLLDKRSSNDPAKVLLKKIEDFRLSI